MKRYPVIAVIVAIISSFGVLSGWILAGWFLEPSPGPTFEASRFRSLKLERQPALSQNTHRTLAAINASSSVTAQSVLGIALARDLPVNEIEGMLDQMHLLPAHSVRSLVVRLLLLRWLDVEPERAMPWALANSRANVATLAEAWCRRDPSAAMDFAGHLASEKDRRGLYTAMAAVLAEEDMDRTIRFINSHADRNRSSNFQSAIRKLAVRDPEQLLTRLDELPPENDWQRSILRVWARQNSKSALAWAIREDSPGTISSVIGSVKNPREALSLLATLTPKQQADAASGVYGVRHQPEAVLEQLDSFTGLTDEAVSILRKRSEEAMQPPKVEPPAPPKPAEQVANDFVSNGHYPERVLKKIDVEELTEAIAALPPDAAHVAHLNYLNAARQADLYEAAAAQVSYLSRDDPRAIGEVSQLGAHWAHHDPRAARTWVENLPPGNLRSWAALNVSRQWSRSNAAAAKQWLDTLPDMDESILVYQ